MISVIFYPNPLEPANREITTVAFGPGVTARSVVPHGLKAESVSIVRNGVVQHELELDSLLGPNDIVSIYPVQRLELAAAVSAIAAWMTAHPIAAFFINLGLSAAVGYAIRALMGGAGQKQVQDPQDSRTYGFGGLQNTYTEGEPVPIVFGRHRIAPATISSHVELFGVGQTQILRTLYAIGEGPIHAFGDAVGPFRTDADVNAAVPTSLGQKERSRVFGVQVNGQPGENFALSLQNVRTGELDQTKITNFSDVELQFLLDHELLGPTTGDVIPNTTGVVAYASKPQWSLSKSFAMTQEADRIAVRVNFPSGLYEFNGSGQLLQESAKIQIRYWEINSVGTPISEVITLPETTFTHSQQSPFSFEQEFTFYDPSTFVAENYNGFAHFDGTNDSLSFSGTLADPAGTGWWNQTTAPNVKFTIMAWIRMDSNRIGNAIFFRTTTQATLNTSTGAMTGYGSGFCLRIDPSLSGSSQKFVFHCGNLGTLTDAVSSATGFTTGLQLVAMTYDGTTNNAQVTFYLNGANQGSATIPNAARIIPNNFKTANLLIGNMNTTSVLSQEEFFHGDMSDWAMYGRVLTPAEISSIYTQLSKYGNHSFVHASSEVGLINAWHLFTNGANVLGGGSSLTANGGLSYTAGTVNNVMVATAESGTAKRALYEVEVARSDAVDTSTLIQDDMRFEAVLQTLDEDFIYPATALFALDIYADDQVSNTRPNVTVMVDGRVVKVWDGTSSPQNPVFVDTWTRQPAWIAADLLTHTRYGTGNIFTYADIDLPSFKAWADYGEEGILDKRGTADFYYNAYSAGQVTLRFETIDNTGAVFQVLPAHWEAGYTIAITDANDTGLVGYETSGFTNGYLTIVSMTTITSGLPAGMSEAVEMVCTWYGGTAPTNATGSPAGGTAQGFIERFAFDGVFDRKEEKAWDALMRVFQAGRAIPVRIGRKIYAFVDRPRSPVAMVTMANMIKGSFVQRWSSKRNRPNSIEIEYLDEDLNYERRPINVDHESIQDPTLFEDLVKRRISLEGVTATTRVLRHGQYQLNIFQTLIRSFEWRQAVDAVAYLPGDVILLSHDVPQIGISGRVWETTSSATSMKFDRPLTLTAGNSYEVTVRHGQDDDIETIGIHASMVPGIGSTTYAAGTAITLAGAGFTQFLPTVDDLYAVGKVGSATIKVQIISLQMDPKTFERTVSALEYSDDVYDDDFGDYPTSSLVSSAPEPPSMTNVGPVARSLHAREINFRDHDGQIVTSIEASWTYANEDRYRVSGADIYLGPDSDNPTALQFVGTTAGTTTQALISGVALSRGTTYRVYVQVRSRGGLARPSRFCPFTRVRIDGWTLIPTAPTGFRGCARGDRVVYTWSPGDSAPVNGYEARVGGWILGQQVFSVGREARHAITDFVASGATNSAGDSSPRIALKAMLGNGQQSAAELLEGFQPSVVGGTVALSYSIEDNWSSVSPYGSVSPVLVHGAVALRAYPKGSGGSNYEVTFNGVQLSGTYESSDFVVAGSPGYYQVHAFVEASQVGPWTIADLDFELGSREAERWTLEGPVVLRADEPEHCSISLEWSYSDTASAGTDYQTFVPGVVYLRSAQFRVTFNRPSTDYDVSIVRMSVRFIQVP